MRLLIALLNALFLIIFSAYHTCLSESNHEINMKDLDDIYRYITNMGLEIEVYRRSIADKKHSLYKFHIQCVNGRNGALSVFDRDDWQNNPNRDGYMKCAEYRNLLNNLVEYQKSSLLSFYSASKNIEKDLFTMIGKDYK